jgi:hypothetical protein
VPLERRLEALAAHRTLRAQSLGEELAFVTVLFSLRDFWRKEE